jgi:phosphoribosylamine--glycine ligase
VRFGDPETEVLMARLGSDLLPLLLGAARGDLRGVELRWAAPCALCVVMASEGYPGSYPKGRPVLGLEHPCPEATVFHAGTALLAAAEGAPQVVTAGGRVLVVTATGQSIDEAATHAYRALQQLHFEGAHYRSDIGHHARGAQS